MKSSTPTGKADPDRFHARSESGRPHPCRTHPISRRTSSETPEFEGSVRDLVRIYENHPESPFHGLKPGPQKTYRSILRRLAALIGEWQIAAITGVDLMRWRREWGGDGKPAMANQMRVVLLAAVTFGTALRLPGCADLATTLSAARSSFPSRPPRTATLVFDQVEAACEAAMERKSLAHAIAYGLMFETTLRLADVVGVWWPARRERESAIIDPATGATWFGLCWEHIDEEGMLRYQPSKTADTTGRTISFPLAMAPLAWRYMKRVPLFRRAGPIVVHARTALPFKSTAFNDGWKKDRDAAGISAKIWARDLRAAGISEGRTAGATRDDAAMIAGHAGTRMVSDVYDRASLAAAERFAIARLRLRNEKSPASRS